MAEAEKDDLAEELDEDAATAACLEVESMAPAMLSEEELPIHRRARAIARALEEHIGMPELQRDYVLQQLGSEESQRYTANH